jgi:hypothetical protein
LVLGGVSIRIFDLPILDIGVAAKIAKRKLARSATHVDDDVRGFPSLRGDGLGG